MIFVYILYLLLHSSSSSLEHVPHWFNKHWFIRSSSHQSASSLLHAVSTIHVNDYKIANRQIFSSPPPPKKIDSGGLKFCFIIYNYYSFLGHILPLISRQLMQRVLRFVNHVTDSTCSYCACLYFILFSLVLYAPVNVVVLFFFLLSKGVVFWSTPGLTAIVKENWPTAIFCQFRRISYWLSETSG